MMPLDESHIASLQDGRVQLELDVGVLRRLLHERGLSLEEVHFLNPSSQRAGRMALKQALMPRNP